VNAVLAFESRLEPKQLLKALLAIEVSLGRVRAERNAPRTVDLDILLIDNLRINTANLVVPHPRMHLRAFVLLPLLELDPAAHIPGIGAARTALQALGTHACQRVGAHGALCGTIAS
jgi:2-amino-4-hydroxy-6-hydroxymethyldihydropteridine diphosphokinase